MPTVRPTALRARIVVLTALLAALLMALPASPASADVDDFSYSSWESRYELSLDADGRSVLRVTETLVAEFPETDQNKGIVRGYPQRFAGSGLSVRILSVTDGEGRPVPYETESDDGALFVLTGTDAYVHGRQTYVIESEMRDVMVLGTESQRDEFYWNLLPLESRQPIGRFRAEIVLSPELTAALTGDVACYQGFEGQTERCDDTLAGPDVHDGSATFTVESGAREAGDGVTVAIGFAPGTVTQPPARRPDPVADWAPVAFGAGSIIPSIAVWIAVIRKQRRRRTATGIVVAQYDVPADLPPLLAAKLLPGKPHPVPAQIVHLAVNGALRLEQEPGKSRPAVRRLIDQPLPQPLDQATMSALFHDDAEVRRIPKSSTGFAKRMTKLVEKGAKEAKKRGWVVDEHSRAARMLGAVSLLMLAAATVAFIVAAVQDRDSLGRSLLALIVAAVVTGISAMVAFSTHEVLSREGAQTYEYLQGVKEFIRVAEADRMRMLQSYQGAERRSDGTVDVVHLYERLLPYAMLFGEEKSWAEVLQTQYTPERQPSWITTAAGIGLYVQLSQYSSRVQSAATYTASSSSGSAGGSTGGGFSGGGGGGGFSGGR